MCGIVGYAGFTTRISLDGAIKEIHNRGPDDHGTEYFNGVALGNTRLAIIDLSKKGHQPMFSLNKLLCIVFNGEIYNFLDVKKQLENKYHFQSNSDTEVILYAYREWGTKCLEKLSGMFAFVLYDRKEKILFGARDRLGQKPLKYYYKGGKLLFASEIKAILSLLDAIPEIDEIAIDNFLTFQYVPAPKTGFKNIYKLPAAHYFIFKDNKLTVHKYWSLNFHKKLRLSKEEWRELVYGEMKKTVKSHLISDVPVGALLSGGLDSSMIVALMSTYCSKRIHTFSIGFEDNTFDESPYAELVSQMYNTNHTRLMVTSRDLINNIEQVVDIYDEPIGDNSILPTMLVAKLASGSVKVALTGDGGDENFAGYDRYTIVHIAKFIAQLSPVLKNTGRLGAKIAFRLHPDKLIERMYRFFSTLDEKFYRRYVNYNSFFTHHAKHSLYSHDFKNSIGDNDSYENFSKYFDEALSDLDSALQIDTHTYLPDDLLYKTDSASGAYGLELRSPFLDHILMEKLALMPSEMKSSLFVKKKLLKDIAISYDLLPKEIVYKRKQGFNVPQNTWFKGPLKTYLTNHLLSSGIIEVIVSKRKIEHYITDYFNTNLNYDNNMFALLMLSLWYDRYID